MLPTMTIREFYRLAQSGKLATGEYRLEKYGRVVYAVTVAEAPGAASLNAPAAAVPEVKAEVKPVAEAAPEVVPALAAPAVGNASRLAALLARGRATVAPAPADLPDDPAPAVPAMSQRQWARLDPDARVRWVRLNLPNITDDDELAEWLACLPK
jgi:hypothetical protein